MIRLAAILLFASAIFSPVNALSIDLWNNLERDVLDLVNQDRSNLGLGTLTGDSRLHDAAVGHSRDMATNNFFSHTGTGGTNAGDRAATAGYSWNRWGENIAAGYLTAESVVTAWLNSPGHRDNMRNGAFTDAGIGLIRAGADADFATYWTLVLAAGDSAAGPPISILQTVPDLIVPASAPALQAPELDIAQVATVPLPPSFWMFAMALLTGLFMQRRRSIAT